MCQWVTRSPIELSWTAKKRPVDTHRRNYIISTSISSLLLIILCLAVTLPTSTKVHPGSKDCSFLWVSNHFNINNVSSFVWWVQDHHVYKTLGNKTLDRRFVDSFGIFGNVLVDINNVKITTSEIWIPSDDLMYLWVSTFMWSNSTPMFPLTSPRLSWQSQYRIWWGVSISKLTQRIPDPQEVPLGKH